MQPPKPQDAFLLGKLIEANCSPMGCRNFMSALAKHFNTQSFHLFVVDSYSQEIRFHVDAGATVGTELIDIYMREYADHDLLMQAVNNSPDGHFYATNLLAPEQNVYADEHFQARGQQLNVVETAMVKVCTTDDWSCYMVCHRNNEQGLYTEDEIKRLNLLAPYISSGIQAGFSIQEEKHSKPRVKAVINTYKIPVALFTDFGQAWVVNDLMEDFIANNPGINWDKNKLNLLDKDNASRLNLALIESEKRINNPSVSDCNEVKIKLDANNIIAFTELTEKDSKQGQETFLGVMMFVLQKQNRAHVTPEQLRQLFDLTRSEANVCVQLMEGLSLKDIAEQQSKSIHTIREHVGNVLKKTGCSTQVLLMSLLSDIPKLIAH